MSRIREEDSKTLMSGGYRCHSCEYRHGGCPRDHIVPYCSSFKLGGCYSCKYRYGKNGTEFTEEETNRWFKRGCETWFPSGCWCKKRKRLGRKRKKRLKKRGLI